MSEPMLTVDNLLKHYAGAERNVFDGISFDVPKGKVLVIICLLYTSDAADDNVRG